jgi:hypothetical protein
MKRFISCRLRFGIIAVAVVCSLPCFAGEVAVLRNGFSIRHEARKVMGNVTRLFVSADGSSYVDVPTAEIEHFEAEISAPDSPLLAKDARNGAPGNQASGFRLPAAVNRSTGATDSRVLDLNEVVNSASGKYRLDPDLVNSVIKAESGFNVRAVSRKGAQGLMQLMPGTASQLGVPNAFDPRANVEGGTRYLRELLERYDFDLIKALAAYNAGPQRVEQYGGVPPYYETRAYVARIVRDFNKKKVAAKGGAAARKSAAAKKADRKTSVAGTKARPVDPREQAKASTAQASE